MGKNIAIPVAKKNPQFFRKKWLFGVHAFVQEPPLLYLHDFGTRLALPQLVVYEMPTAVRLKRAVLLVLRICGCIAMFAFSASVSGSTVTGSVELAWNPSISTNVVGYYIFYGVACREYACSNYVAGAVSTNASVTGLVPGTTYYFSATAVDSLGNQSPFSERNHLYRPPKHHFHHGPNAGSAG